MIYCCSVVDIKLCADFRRCLLTVSAQHALDYAIYVWGGAFDVAHEVTIIIAFLGQKFSYCSYR